MKIPTPSKSSVTEKAECVNLGPFSTFAHFYYYEHEGSLRVNQRFTRHLDVMIFAIVTESFLYARLN